MVLWLVLDPVKEVQADFNVPMMICAWSVAEIVRSVRTYMSTAFQKWNSDIELLDVNNNIPQISIHRTGTGIMHFPWLTVCHIF